MDIYDYWLHRNQQKEIEEIQTWLNHSHVSVAEKLGKLRDFASLLQEENQQLRLRLGVLIRLMVEKKIFAAEEFASVLKAAQTSISIATKKPPLARKPRVVKNALKSSGNPKDLKP